MTEKRQDPCSPTDTPYDFRTDRADAQRADVESPQPENLDRALVIDRSGTYYCTAMFSKTLRHNNLGEVEENDFIKLEVALRSGEQRYFDRIERDPNAVRKLVNPQAALAYGMVGADSHSVIMPAAPSMTSEEAGSELVEVYGMALLRDESFRSLSNGTTSQEPVVTELLTDLNSFGVEFKGPKDSGSVTRETLFRGPGFGETVGPYVSQFLLHDIGYGKQSIDQTLETELDDVPSVSVAGWLDIQRGITPPGANLSGQTRRINSPRALGSYVHSDALAQAFFNAALILLGSGAPMNPAFPDLDNEAHFATCGPPDCLARVWEVAQLALQAAWRQKWTEHRRLRPEVMAGRVHFTLAGSENYNLDPGLLSSNMVSRVLSKNTSDGHATYLLSQMYPEGSPAHPSYPAGHAAVAGACSTVLKAYFDGDTLMSSLDGGNFKIIESVTGTETMTTLESSAITDPNVVNNLTVAIELNKLASNIATGRNMAGVHYRSDGDLGILLGEKVAIQFLKDIAATYNEDFTGYQLRKFDGTLVTVI
jgi:hypothetical protein